MRRDSDEVRRRPLPGLMRRCRRAARLRRVGEARMLWHADHDLQRRRRGDRPRRLLVRRLPARRRDRPVRARDGRVEEFAREGGLVLGICNGFQVLCEAGLLPGALLPNLSLKFVCRQVELEVVGPRRRSRAPAMPASGCRSRSSTRPGRYYAPETARPARGRRPGPTPLRRPGRTRTGRCDDIAGRVQRRGNVFGLMPHPERAVDPLDAARATACGSSSRCERMSSSTSSLRGAGTGELGLTDVASTS